MYHQRTSLNSTTTNYSSSQPSSFTPVTARRVLQPSVHFLQQQRYHMHNNDDANQPYSSDVEYGPPPQSQRNPTLRASTHENIHSPIPSPSIKRKYNESMIDYGKQIDELSRQMQTIIKQQEDIVETLREIRKANNKTKKLTTSLVHSNQFNMTSNKILTELPVFMHNNENLFATMSPSLSTTTILCRLIRKLYSSTEIENGAALNTNDERFETIKQAMIEAFFKDQPERFESFWNIVGSKHLGGQKRAARSRSKKASLSQSQTSQANGSRRTEVNSDLNIPKQFIDNDDDDED